MYVHGRLHLHCAVHPSDQGFRIPGPSKPHALVDASICICFEPLGLTSCHQHYAVFGHVQDASFQMRPRRSTPHIASTYSTSKLPSFLPQPMSITVTPACKAKRCRSASAVSDPADMGLQLLWAIGRSQCVSFLLCHDGLISRGHTPLCGTFFFCSSLVVAELPSTDKGALRWRCFLTALVVLIRCSPTLVSLTGFYYMPSRSWSWCPASVVEALPADDTVLYTPLYSRSTFHHLR